MNPDPQQTPAPEPAVAPDRDKRAVVMPKHAWPRKKAA